MIVGKLQGSSLVDLLEVLSSSKPLELEGGPPVFDLRLFYETQPGAQVAVGQLVLRGPDLVSAEWGELKGTDALAALVKQPGGRVRIIRSGPADTTLRLGPRLGSVAALLAEPMAARPAATWGSAATDPILEGVLGIEDDIGLEGFEDDISLDGSKGLEDAVSIADLFEVFGTSRQATELVISRGAAPMGWLLLQGGQLLQIRVEGTGGGETPEERFRGLVVVQPRVDRFALYRRTETVEAQRLGPLTTFAEIARIEAHRSLVPRPAGTGASTSSPKLGLTLERTHDPDSVSLFESTSDTESVSLQLPPIADPTLLVPDPPLRPASEAPTRELPGRPMLDSDEPTRDEPTREEMEADLFSLPLEPTPAPGSTSSPAREASREPDAASRDSALKETSPREAPPREVQPRDVQPRDVQPRDVQPREAGPRESAPRDPPQAATREAPRDMGTREARDPASTQISSPRAIPGSHAPASSGTGAPAAPRESHPPRQPPPLSRPIPAPARQPAYSSDEDTADPPTYTPEPGSPPRPTSTGPRVVQPGVRTGNTDVSAARRTHQPPSSQREPSPTPRPVLRVRTAPAPEPEEDPLTDRGPGSARSPANHPSPSPLTSPGLSARGSSAEDQELKLAVAQLREELARQGAQLEVLSRDSSMSWGMLAIGIQVFTLVLVVALLMLALLSGGSSAGVGP